MSRFVAVRSVSFFRRSRFPNPTENEMLTPEQKETLREAIGGMPPPIDESSKAPAVRVGSSVTDEMDSIRARGFLRFRYNYTPPTDVGLTIKAIAAEHGVTDTFRDIYSKEVVLKEAGNRLRHFVPSSRLHDVRRVADLVAFYTEPVSNLTRYAQMARDDGLPANVAIQEHPRRFHPNDTEAVHGGVTAFPGTGGEVYSIRQKRLLRQFRPKKEWFDYEDRSFDYKPVDKGMPWDPEVARKMDRQTTRRFLANRLHKK